MNKNLLPSYVIRYFWGDTIQELDLRKHKKYILQTLLEQGDNKALNWLFATFDKNNVKTLLPSLKLSDKSANFWRIYLA